MLSSNSAAVDRRSDIEDPLLSAERQQQQENASSRGNSPYGLTCKFVGSVTFFLFVIGFLVVAAKTAHTGTNDNQYALEVECPNSPALIHSQCGLIFEITDFMCKDVKEEIERRILGKDGWVDPKSQPGTYLLIESQATRTIAQRTSGDGKNYVDKFIFTYTDVEGKGCLVTGCSVSQVPSYFDFSTNYCNMRNLICGKAEGCKLSRHDIRPPRETFTSCPFHDIKQCTK